MEKRQFNGRDYLLEHTILADYSLIKTWKADKKGNCSFKLASRNFNPDMATAGKICIAEAEEIVEPGQINGDDIQVSSIFVHRLIQANNNEPEFTQKECCPIGKSKGRELIAKRAAQEVKNGSYVVLGCGLPKAIESYTPEGIDVHYVYPETGVFGGIKKGQPTPKVIDGCMTPLGLRKNAAIVKVSDGFCAIRGSHMKNIFMEAYQVSRDGDIADRKSVS